MRVPSKRKRTASGCSALREQNALKIWREVQRNDVGRMVSASCCHVSVRGEGGMVRDAIVFGSYRGKLRRNPRTFSNLVVIFTLK